MFKQSAPLGSRGIDVLVARLLTEPEARQRGHLGVQLLQARQSSLARHPASVRAHRDSSAGGRASATSTVRASFNCARCTARYTVDRATLNSVASSATV